MVAFQKAAPVEKPGNGQINMAIGKSSNSPCQWWLVQSSMDILEVSPWSSHSPGSGPVACEVWKHKKERGLKALTEFLGRMGKGGF